MGSAGGTSFSWNAEGAELAVSAPNRPPGPSEVVSIWCERSYFQFVNVRTSALLGLRAQTTCHWIPPCIYERILWYSLVVIQVEYNVYTHISILLSHPSTLWYINLHML